MVQSFMASPPIPPSLEHLAARPFSFYPAIVNVEHNEWLFRKATWSEIQVVNCRSGEEVWISRRFVGDVSRVDDPVLIVGLSRELELKSGMVVPFQRRIIEMPLAVNAPPPPRGSSKERSAPAPVVGIRLEPSDRRVFRLILIAAGTIVGLYVAAIAFTHMGELRQKRVVYVGSDQSYQRLNGRDDYLDVVRKTRRTAGQRSHRRDRDDSLSRAQLSGSPLHRNSDGSRQGQLDVHRNGGSELAYHPLGECPYGRLAPWAEAILIRVSECHDPGGRSVAGAGHDEFQLDRLTIGDGPTAAETFELEGIGESRRGYPHTILSVCKHHAFDDRSGCISNQ